MRARKRLAFGLRTYSNLTARRARARIDNRIFDAEMAGEGEYYTVSPRIRELIRHHEEAADGAFEQAYDEMYPPYDEDFEPDEDTEMFCDWEEDDIWEDPNEAIVPGTEYLLGEDIQLDEDDPDLENWYDE